MRCRSNGATRRLEEAEKRAREVARLEAKRRELAALPILEALPAKSVRLPDPRPAPKDVSEVSVLCREDRIWVVDIAALREKSLRRADFVIRSKKLDPDGSAVARRSSMSSTSRP